METLHHHNSLLDATQYFASESNCLQYLKQIHWPNGIDCPHCHHTKIYKFTDGKRFKCALCRKIFTAKTKTVFKRSKIPLSKWFIAIYISMSNKKGISSVQLSKYIEVTQCTAWFMLHRIRKMLKQKNPALLTGTVEVDETFVGGKNKNRHWNKKVKNGQGRSFKDKTPVFGMFKRDGEVRSKKVPNTSEQSLMPIIGQNIAYQTNIMSDEWTGYKGLSDHYKHKTVDHRRKQYVLGDVYTNNIECYWSHVKRTIIGVYHHVSRKYMNRYCHEFDFRYNTRTDTEFTRFNKALSLCYNKTMSYRQIKKT